MIYRYYNFCCKKIKTILKSQLYFSSPDAFNDPFEFGFIDKRGPIPKADEENIKQCFQNVKYSRGDTNTEDDPCCRIDVPTIVDQFLTMGVCCFCTNHNNIPMWSHYADSHRGFCIGYDLCSDLPDGKFSMNKHNYFIRNVDYNPETRQTPLFLNEKEFAICVPERIIFNKGSNWQQEGEVRLITATPGRKSFPKEIFKSIYFGCRVEQKKNNKNDNFT